MSDPLQILLVGKGGVSQDYRLQYVGILVEVLCKPTPSSWLRESWYVVKDRYFHVGDKTNQLL